MCNKMNSDLKMTAEEFKVFEKEVQNVFDVVRVLDENLLNQILVNSDNSIECSPCQCYAFWNKNQRCENCISARVITEKGQRTKLEVLDSTVYQVFSKYAEIDGKPCVIEMLSAMKTDELIDSHGRDELFEILSDYKKELYTDALVGCYNRRYYEDCIKNEKMTAGVAMIDIDNFKGCNDTFGHDAGDMTLKAFVDTTLKLIRKTDMLIRLGGDEFALIFPGMTQEKLGEKLESIRMAAFDIRVLGYQELTVSLSIGGVYAMSGESLSSAMIRADAAMYKAKALKNSVVLE